MILTNAPRPSTVIPAQLDRLGLPRDAYDCVVTSGDSTRAEIAKFGAAPAYRIGPEKDDALFAGLDISFAPLADASFIICTGLIDDQTEEPDAYRSILEEAAAKNLPMICANPDIVVNWGGRRIWCAGALAEIYKEFGGEVTYGGKPYAPIYELAISAINERRGEETATSKIIAVGDGLGTDIAGANSQDIDAVLVAGDGGIHEGTFDEDEIAERLGHANVTARAVMERLQW